ncbi:hypothetical protein [Roseivivax sediminis]|uniref:Uncharacterized protein n=1 Tax=Roseivivax sediminis TaxID=936889 RepID=A0A1I2D8Y6_9RHOB|nr:hypothetical protein [Roseivivax sediminis]SFE77017.1 hypothetical protein SAMN04515678_11614 [Roseivivax sediminis]
MNPLWLLRMRKWAQHPPSWRRVLLVLAVVAICAALFALERWALLPEWMTADPRGPGRVPR